MEEAEARYVLGTDAGTESIRSIVFDLHGAA